MVPGHKGGSPAKEPHGASEEGNGRAPGTAPSPLERELREAREDARLARETAERASRAKSDFLANMSHELRTPLNGIMGMVELTLLEDLPEKVRTYQKLLKQSARSLLEIINDLLDLARIESGSMELRQAPFELRSALHSFLSSYAALAQRKGLALRSSVDEGLPRRIVGDRGRLGQVVANVVGNAIKFTDAGEISVHVGPDPNGPEPPPGRVRLLCRVTDTGIGIPPENLDSIFEAFSQVGGPVHMKHGGTGLGLAISKHMVELMGGNLGVETRPGGGSTFWFTFEAGKSEEAPAEAEPASPRACVGCLRILLAEDNPVSQIFARTLLEKMGHSVAVASDGRSALSILSREKFDLVLMDVRMPEIDGVELTRLIREGQAPGIRKDLPVVALTAHALKGDRERFLAAGMDDYLSKPFEPKELERVLGRWAGTAQDKEGSPDE